LGERRAVDVNTAGTFGVFYWTGGGEQSISSRQVGPTHREQEVCVHSAGSCFPLSLSSFLLPPIPSKWRLNRDPSQSAESSTPSVPRGACRDGVWDLCCWCAGFLVVTDFPVGARLRRFFSPFQDGRRPRDSVRQSLCVFRESCMRAGRDIARCECVAEQQTPSCLVVSSLRANHRGRFLLESSSPASETAKTSRAFVPTHHFSGRRPHPG